MPVGSDTLHPVEDPRHRGVRSTSSAAARRASRRSWSALWPKLLAVALFVGGWQVVVWSGWKPEYVLPSPFTVFDQFWQDKRAAVGRDPDDAAARDQGLRDRAGHRRRRSACACPGRGSLRSGVGSMITGLQTMPSIAWFPARDRALRAERSRRSCSSSSSAPRRRSPTGSSTASTTSRRCCCAPDACSARAASRRSATSCSRPRCRRSSAA